MAINLFNKYGSRANPPSIDYPQGSIKNRSAPDVKDGTPLDADWANDHQGFFQSILSYFGVTANGTPDKVGASQYFDALMSDPSESKRGMPLKASNAEVQAGTNASKMVTPAGLASRTATDARTGLVELATNAEVAAGTDTSRAVTPAGLRSAYQLPLGQGQTWQDVTSSRAPDTTYTNTTGRAIFVNIGCATQHNSVFFEAKVNGVKVAVYTTNSQWAQGKTISFIVPNGSTYGATGYFNLWSELR